MKVAPPDAIAKAEAERDARLKEKAVIGSLLDEALDDIASLNAILSRQPLFAARLFRVALNLVRRIAPLALAGWVIAQFKHLRGRPTWQELGFAILVLIAYHLIAWISLPFFNAAYRKFLYLNGYPLSPDLHSRCQSPLSMAVHPRPQTLQSSCLWSSLSFSQ